MSEIVGSLDRRIAWLNQQIEKQQAEIEQLRSVIRRHLATETSQQNEIERLQAEIRRLEAALDESVKLQSHYAKQINVYDGGTRMVFADGEAWLRRLEETRK